MFLIQQRIFMASSLRPFDSSQRGDSGRKMRPMKSRPQGMSWTAKGMSHCEWLSSMVVLTPKLIQKPTRPPICQPTSYRPTRRPRTAGGDSSEM